MTTVLCHTPGGIPKWLTPFHDCKVTCFLPRLFPLFSHVQHIDSSSTRFWHWGNSHYYWESITLLLKAVPSAISARESRVVAMLYTVIKPSYVRFLENVSILMLLMSLMSCPAHLWLMKEQTFWFLEKVFSLVNTFSRISRVRSLKLQ